MLVSEDLEGLKFKKTLVKLTQSWVRSRIILDSGQLYVVRMIDEDRIDTRHCYPIWPILFYISFRKGAQTCRRLSSTLRMHFNQSNAKWMVPSRASMMALYGSGAISTRSSNASMQRSAQLRHPFQFHQPLGIDTRIECISRKLILNLRLHGVKPFLTLVLLFNMKAKRSLFFFNSLER